MASSLDACKIVATTLVCVIIASLVDFSLDEPIGDGPVNTGIKLLGKVDANGRQKFAIMQGAEDAAATYLIQQLNTAEIMLMNSEDEEGEGATSIRQTGSTFETKNGGHGWQGEWVSMTIEQIRQRIIELAPDNLGGHWSAEGTISPKTVD